jgi:hypothetical protein
MSALWGKLASDVLMEKWDAAMEDVNQARQLRPQSPRLSLSFWVVCLSGQFSEWLAFSGALWWRMSATRANLDIDARP